MLIPYLIYCFFNEFLNYYLYRVLNNDTYLFINLFSLLEYLFISYFYFLILKNRRYKKSLVIVSVIYLIYFVIDSLFIEDITIDFSSGPAAIEAIILLVYSILYLFEEINNTVTLFIYSKKSFWIVVAIIIYISGTFFLFIFAQNNMADPTFQKQYLVMNSVLYIIKSLLFSIAFIIIESNENESISYRQSFTNPLEDSINLDR